MEETAKKELTPGERAKAWRKREDLTLEQAREKVGLSIGYISDLETGVCTMSNKAYKRYNHVAPDLFPLQEMGLLI